MAHFEDFERARAPQRDQRPGRRLAEYCRGYLALIGLALSLAVLLSGAEFTRAYLLKVLIDDVAIPQASIVGDARIQNWLPNLSMLSPDATDRPADAKQFDIGLEQEEKEAISAHLESNLMKLLALAVLIAVAIPGLNFFAQYTSAYTLGRINVDMSKEACAKLLVLPLSFHHGRRRGDVYARVVEDLGVAHRALSLVFGDILTASVSILVGVAFMFAVSWQLTVFVAAGAPLLFGTISFFGRLIRRGARRRQQQVGEVTRRLLEILEGIKVIKAFHAEETEYTSYSRETVRLFKRSLRVTRIRALSRASVEFLNQIMVLAGLCLGVYMLFNGLWNLTLGDLAAFMVITSLVYRPLKRLARGWAQFQDAMAGAERYFEVLDAPLEIHDAPGAVDLSPLSRAVSVRNLTFGYGPETVLRNIDFEVGAGEVVAIVGRTGAGKTTLADLLLRLYDPQEGRIEIEGTDLRQVRRTSLIAQMAVVTQEPFLFDGSIRENLLYGHPLASEEEMLSAARAAHVDEFAAVLPDGYDTQVGASGVRLSGGQRQRITIGRAILKDPSILILDEATSSLDSKSEKFVQVAIDALLSGNRTVFVIAHRLSTVRRSDRILVLDKGRLVQQGTHGELMESEGLYRELVTLQAGEFSAPETA